MTPDIIARLALCLRYAGASPKSGAPYAEWRAYAVRILMEAKDRGLRIELSGVAP